MLLKHKGKKMIRSSVDVFEHLVIAVDTFQHRSQKMLVLDREKLYRI